MVRSSIEAYMKGDLEAAFESIKGVPDTISEPRFFVYRASLLLAVGRVDEASKDVERALNLNPNYSDAFALQSVIAVVQNEREKALDIARKAVEADPKSAAALIALSYAQQANFDLEGALESLKQAVQVNPNDALAWARLSELHLSFARLDEALEAAQRAVTLDPNLARTQMVLGFAYLTQVNTTESKRAFERSIELDQAGYLSRLGLGLAKIREGDLAEGRREIEIAASLDPNNSIVRSYLGKAYYEEKRIPLDQREYAIAKELDPKDPTPWFYDAIAKQTTNRPVEALQDMQQAIELNNNRLVYRSRLLLDSDLAARSAALGQIYNDLGFQELGLVEGWKAVNTDPTNFSAHRLLADTYATLPRHEVARVSELLQSQLLQPINITPIQPRLAESNLFLISSVGPARLSFNEFNPLFTRNGIWFQTVGLAGENNTYGGEGVLSGIYNKASLSLGGFHFQTDGWRANADQRDAIANAFLQFELSPKTSIQTEYRYRDVKLGDVALRFAPDDFRPNFREQDVINSGRLGFRHAFSPNSVLIGNYMYQTEDRRQRDSSPTIRLFDKGDDRAHSGEMQYLFRSRYTNVVSGVGYFNIDSKDSLLTEVVVTPPFPFPPQVMRNPPQLLDNDVRHTNVYLYSYLQFLRNVTFTLGGSGDFFDTDVGGVESRSQFNPKFGITWNPLPDTTLRAAAFRTLKRILITNQTLEPTQVSGFNQFFDDFNATRAWLYGAAVDQKFTRSIYGGLEYTFRDLKVPVASLVRGVSLGDASWDEQLLRHYLFWTPHEWVALSTGYDWEKFDRDKLFNDGIRRVETHRVPLGVNVFHPSGLSASLKATYINQRGVFRRINTTGPFETGKDDFWTVDAGINYRLPQRYGFITVGVTNLFDQKFKYFDTDRGSANRNPRVIPDRVFFGRITLAIP